MNNWIEKLNKKVIELHTIFPPRAMFFRASSMRMKNEQECSRNKNVLIFPGWVLRLMEKNFVILKFKKICFSM